MYLTKGNLEGIKFTLSEQDIWRESSSTIKYLRKGKVYIIGKITRMKILEIKSQLCYPIIDEEGKLVSKRTLHSVLNNLKSGFFQIENGVK